MCMTTEARNESWHRAQVDMVLGDGDVHVRLVDYGSSMDVALQE